MQYGYLMNNSWKDHLHFTRSERSGAIALSISIILILLSWLTFGYLTAPEPIDFSEFEAEVEAFYEQYEPEKNDYDNYAYRSKGSNKSYFTKEKSPQKSYKKPAVKLFPFNPNTASFSELTTLGLPKKTANTLINYREKGGKFYKKENLKNVYGLTDEDYLRLEDYIRIPAKAKQKKNNNIARKESPAKPTPPPVVDPFLFDPNTATFDDFVTLGLSERVAHTLINYREKGGKFFEKEDLQKIYNLQATDYNRLAPYINIAPQPEPAKVPEPQLVVEKIPEPAPTTVNININAATPEEWQQLPERHWAAFIALNKLVKLTVCLTAFFRLFVRTYNSAQLLSTPLISIPQVPTTSKHILISTGKKLRSSSHIADNTVRFNP